MTLHRPATAPLVAAPQVWSALPNDLQQRAVRLLVQLAFAYFRQHTPLTTQEIHDEHTSQQPQDSPRPS